MDAPFSPLPSLFVFFVVPLPFGSFLPPNVFAFRVVVLFPISIFFVLILTVLLLFFLLASKSNSCRFNLRNNHFLFFIRTFPLCFFLLFSAFLFLFFLTIIFIVVIFFILKSSYSLFLCIYLIRQKLAELLDQLATWVFLEELCLNCLSSNIILLLESHQELHSKLGRSKVRI